MDALNKLSLRGAQRRGNPQNHLKTKSWIASLRSQWRQTRLVQRFPIVPAAAIRLRLCNDPAVSAQEIGRAHVLTPVTNAHLVCRMLLEKKNIKILRILVLYIS